MIKEEKIIEHRLINLVHTFLLLLGIMLLLGVVAFMLFGLFGFVIMAVTFIFLIFLTPRISPHFVLKMYNGKQLAYHEASRLYDILSELSKRVQLDSMPRLYYLPSNIMNAFTVGNRNDSAIGITDGMLKHLNIRELTGILAHEISHIKHNDMKVMGTADIISRLTSVFSTLGQFILIINLPLILLDFASISLIPILLLITAPMISGLLQLALSRTREFDADIDAARLTGDPTGLAEALKKVEYYSGGLFSKIFIPGYKVPNPSIFRTHPHTEERIKRLMQIEMKRTPLPIEIITPGEDLFSFPLHFDRVTKRPRWRIGGTWY